MYYDFDYYPSYRSSYYYRPRYYYSSYSSPWYRYPSSYTTYSIHRPYISPNLDYELDIPNYKYRYYTTFTPRTPVWSAADKYSFIHGLTFRETAADIRYSASKVLDDIRSPRSVSVPRFALRESTPNSGVDDMVYKGRRAWSHVRSSEAPSYHNISKCIVY